MSFLEMMCCPKRGLEVSGKLHMSFSVKCDSRFREFSVLLDVNFKTEASKQILSNEKITILVFLFLNIFPALLLRYLLKCLSSSHCEEGFSIDENISHLFCQQYHSHNAIRSTYIRSIYNFKKKNKNCLVAFQLIIEKKTIRISF